MSDQRHVYLATSLRIPQGVEFDILYRRPISLQVNHSSERQ